MGKAKGMPPLECRLLRAQPPLWLVVLGRAAAPALTAAAAATPAAKCGSTCE
jgi:hypothetical protein